MSITLLIVALVLGDGKPGPLDAFRANYASIKVEFDFDYVDGIVDCPGGPWSAREAHFVERPDSEIVGHWACDGTAEYYRFSSTDGVLEKARRESARLVSGKAQFQFNFIPKVEALWDGELLIDHHQDPISANGDRGSSWKVIQAQIADREPGRLVDSRAPFYWGMSYTFPQILKSQFTGSPNYRGRGRRDGHPVEVEAFRLAVAGGWYQFEVAYDASVGFLPRFARTVGFNPSGPSLVKEMYLVEARPCSSGGFVPTEWYNAVFAVDNFMRKFPNYDTETQLKPIGRVGGGHFLAKNFKNRLGAVALTELDGVDALSAIGGLVRLRPTLSSLTLDEVKSRLGRKLTDAARPIMPSIDANELHEFDTHPPRDGRFYWIIGLAVVIISFLAIRYRKLRPMTCLFHITILSGCGYRGEPVVKITADFTDTEVFFHPNNPIVPMKLVLRNDGTEVLRIRDVVGGCSCRQVDRKTLPVDVRPGQSISLDVRMTLNRMTSPHEARFDIESDKGHLAVAASFVSLVSHQIHPDAPTQPLMHERDDWSFDFVHRSIYRRGFKSDITPVFPGNFVAKKTGTTTGKVGGTVGYDYTEDTYSLTLTDREIGLHKETIVLKGDDNFNILEAPVVWERVPYLSTVPNRVSIGSRPIRVFLRCPDDSIELTRTLSAPEGIKAVVTSSRELTVSVTDGVPGVISGVIEVGTTAEELSPLQIPVVRYQPSASGEPQSK